MEQECELPSICAVAAGRRRVVKRSWGGRQAAGSGADARPTPALPTHRLNQLASLLGGGNSPLVDVAKPALPVPVELDVQVKLR